MAAPLLDCYDPGLDDFADLAGDFDFLSGNERESWLARQWMMMADGGGWRSDLERALDKLRQSQLGLLNIESTARAAFSGFIKREREEAARADRALARVRVLDALQQQSPAHLWRVEADVGSLPSGACYGRTSWTPGPLGAAAGKFAASFDPGVGLKQPKGAKLTVLPQRAFLADAGPSYFWTPSPSTMLQHTGCGWSTPLRLSLGTFPWVYGHRLQAPAPGLLWLSNSTQHPAVLALRIGAAFWHPEGNLLADARDVLSAWKHWRKVTAPLVDPLPTSPQGSGEVYRQGERLVAHMGSAEIAGVNGPRGFICIAAYNHIQERFAAFFAMRRALLRSRRHLSPELREVLMTNPDPCVRQQLGVAVLKFA